MTARPDTSPTARRSPEYHYDHFTTKLMLEDMRFHKGSLAPGQPVSDLRVEDAFGEMVSLLGSGRPLLLVTGSMTCPMTTSSMPLIEQLHSEFGDRVEFTLLSTREAHPGEHFPQPTNPSEARHQAQVLRRGFGVPFRVVVDDEGRLHQLLDSKPNAAFLFDADGTLVFRSIWASDERGLRQALGAVANGEGPASSQSTAMWRPMLRAIGVIDEVITRAGPGARRDLRRSMPPMAVAARLARAFSFLEPTARGAIGLGITMVLMLVPVAALATAVALL